MRALAPCLLPGSAVNILPSNSRWMKTEHERKDLWLTGEAGIPPGIGWLISCIKLSEVYRIFTLGFWYSGIPRTCVRVGLWVQETVNSLPAKRIHFPSDACSSWQCSWWVWGAEGMLVAVKLPFILSSSLQWHTYLGLVYCRLLWKSHRTERGIQPIFYNNSRWNIIKEYRITESRRWAASDPSTPIKRLCRIEASRTAGDSRRGTSVTFLTSFFWASCAQRRNAWKQPPASSSYCEAQAWNPKETSVSQVDWGKEPWDEAGTQNLLSPWRFAI